jgi:hypothetical protein
MLDIYVRGRDPCQVGLMPCVVGGATLRKTQGGLLGEEVSVHSDEVVQLCLNPADIFVGWCRLVAGPGVVSRSHLPCFEETVHRAGLIDNVSIRGLPLLQGS